MSARTRNRLLIYLMVVALSTAAGPFYGLVFLAGAPPAVLRLAALDGLIGGAIFWAVFLFAVPSRFGEPLRRRAFPVRLAAYAGFILVLVPLTGALAGAVAGLAAAGRPALLIEWPPWTIFAYVGGVTLTLLIGLQVGRMIGPRVLGNVIVGRYGAPVEEVRIFLFIDVVGSTELAQRLGDLGVQRLLSRLFFDIGAPIAEHGGEIYDYVGDEVIVTWPEQRGLRSARCVRCFFAVTEQLAARAADYRARFGVVPQLRGGLHGGPIVVGECGDLKRAVVYFGDTINTAARITEQAKQSAYPLLVSGPLRDRLQLPDAIEVAPIGDVVLRGRRTAMALYGLRRLGSAAGERAEGG